MCIHTHTLPRLHQRPWFCAGWRWKFWYRSRPRVTWSCPFSAALLSLSTERGREGERVSERERGREREREGGRERESEWEKAERAREWERKRARLCVYASVCMYLCVCICVYGLAPASYFLHCAFCRGALLLKQRPTPTIKETYSYYKRDLLLL